MRKKVLLLVLVTILTSLLLVGCNKNNQEDIYTKLHPHISNCQTSLYVTGDENLDISLAEYFKEELFIADGKVSDVITTNTLLIKPKKSDYLNYTYNYKIIGDLGSIEGALEKTSLGVAFKDTINNLHEIGDIKSLELTFNDNTTSFDFTRIDKIEMPYKDIVKIAYDKIKDKFPIDSLDREIYIKLINDDIDNRSNYFWYVAFLKDTDNFYSLVIDLNGKIVSEKNATS